MCWWQNLFQETGQLLTIELRVAPEMVNMRRGLQIARSHHPSSLPLLLDKSFNSFYWDNLVSSAVNVELWAGRLLLPKNRHNL
jgi:hypothetical protein